MRRVLIKPTRQFKCNESYEGVPLEIELEKMTMEGQKLTISASPVYTAREDGVVSETNIRTDKMQQAQDNMTKLHGNRLELKKFMKEKAEKKTNPSEDSGQSTQVDN